ncbi:MAG TPA: preprotein translocase subunit SecE [Spirochaetota bacterium]|nr:preprotein translocase subunit SecE [Spirochaetota bacterium]HQO00820.1 preprotein translocase subunit SecE [Spirochaetota bacterium]HQP48031.1 preprotein translocase subunit SecE [Spirochaetota bacterium]
MKMLEFIRESREELKKVAWPEKEEVSNFTIVVIVTLIFVSVFLGMVDFVLNKIIGLLVN